MLKRYRDLSQSLTRVPISSALRARVKEGYSTSDLKSDLLAGVIVGMVAVPLAMALAIASGVPPQHGLYTSAIAGVIVPLLGGSRFQVSGPTAAFVVILAPIVQHFGLSGLLLAGMMAGMILIAMGLTRIGKIIQFIPHPVTTGFTMGIAVVIGTLQLKDLFGLTTQSMPDNFFAKVVTLIKVAPTWQPAELIVGALTLFLLFWWPRVNRKIPGPLFAVVVMGVACAIAKWFLPQLTISTLGSKFNGIPHTLPHPVLPWTQGEHRISFETFHALLPSAIAIALLGAIESLLSAVVADGMAKTRHDPDAELLGLGIGNMICPFFGGIAATGAIARTATNIRFGAKSPFASAFHGLFVLVVIIVFAPYISYLPMASLSAVLLLVAYNMSDYKNFTHILKVAPRSDVSVLLTCFSFTVIFDMVMGVAVGTALAALLFIKRMANLTEAHILSESTESRTDLIDLTASLPKEIVLYEIAGPLFFGAAQRAVEAISTVSDEVRVVILDLDHVPAMDITGLVALETTIRQLNARQRLAVFVGVRQQPKKLILKSDLFHDPKKARIRKDLAQAVDEVRKELAAGALLKALKTAEK